MTQAIHERYVHNNSHVAFRLVLSLQKLACTVVYVAIVQEPGKDKRINFELLVHLIVVGAIRFSSANTSSL